MDPQLETIELRSPRLDKKYVNDHIFKVLVLGEMSVGKTSLIARFVNGTFENNRKATLGVDFSSKALELSEETAVRLHLWDLAGQERLGTQLPMYFRDARAVIIVYDASKPDTTRGFVSKWKELVDKNCTIGGVDYKPPTIILANKVDLINGLNDSDLANLDRLRAETNCLSACFVSAKTGNGIEGAIRLVVKAAISEEEALAKLLAKKSANQTRSEGTVDIGRSDPFLSDEPQKASMCGCFGIAKKPTTNADDLLEFEKPA